MNIIQSLENCKYIHVRNLELFGQRMKRLAERNEKRDTTETLKLPKKSYYNIILLDSQINFIEFWIEDRKILVVQNNSVCYENKWQMNSEFAHKCAHFYISLIVAENLMIWFDIYFDRERLKFFFHLGKSWENFIASYPKCSKWKVAWG